MVTNIGYHKMGEKVQEKILRKLKSYPSGLQVEELGDKLCLTRHTVGKYLEILRAE